MSYFASNFAEVEEIIALLASTIASVDKLPQGAERNAAFKQIEKFQERIGRILVERGIVSGGHS
jgi:hypothetical protein